MSRSMQPITQSSSAVPDAVPSSASGGISPAIQRSQNGFRAALPELLKTKTASQRWVAFCGDELVAFGCTKAEAFQECLRRGLKRGTFVVRLVQVEAPPDVEILVEV